MSSRGFSLVELLFVISISLALASLTALSIQPLLSQISLNSSAQTLASKLRALQAKATCGHKTLVLQQTNLLLAPGTKIQKFSTIAFSSSGFPPPGGAGTIVLQNHLGKTRKVVVAASGRVRIE
jgi:prepilin-type N-terminal cleavage/methylation domain-containing protein